MKLNRNFSAKAMSAALLFGFVAISTPQAVVLATAGCAGKAYWTNSNGQVVEVVDLATNTSTASISGVGASQRAAVSPDGSRVLVAGSNKATIIDTSTNTVVHQINVGSTPLGVAFHPSQRIVYVANYGSNSVSVISLATNTVTATITGITGAYGLAISPDGSKLYATQTNGFSGAGAVRVINTSTNVIAASITVGNSPVDIALSADGSTAYTVNYSGPSVSRINLSTNTVTATWALTASSFPRGIAVGSAYLYVGLSALGKVAKVDLSSGSSTDITAGSTIQHVFLSSDQTKLYVSQNGVSPRSVAPELEIFNTSTDASIGYVSGLSGSPNPTQAAVCPIAAPSGAPDIQLSSSSGSVVAGSPAGSLYTISQLGWINPTSYSIAPSAPAGMTFNTSTGLLSGTPTTTQSATTYTITATSGGQTDTATFALTITLAPPNISLSTSTVTATVGTPIGPNYTISNSGGAATSYSLTPPAPAGLTFDTSTGLLSGTPSAAQVATIYTVTAGNSTNIDFESFTLTINPAAPDISLSSGSVSAVVGFSIGAPYTLTNAGGTADSYSISPALPAGLSFDTATGLVSGAPTAASGATTYTITATNAGGSDSATFVLTVTVATTTTAVSTTNAPVVTQTTLVGPGNAATVAAAPGTGEALVDGKAVAVELLNVDVPAAAKEPELRSPAEVKQIQAAANDLVSELNDLLPVGQDAPVEVKNTPTGAELTGIADIPVPVEDVAAVKTPEAAVLVAGTDATGEKAATSDSGGVLEIVDGGQVATVAYGLTPGAVGELYVLSTPILLDSFKVATTGTFRRQAKLPATLEPGDHTIVVATQKLTVSLGLKVRERILPTRTSKVWAKLPAKAQTSTFLTVLSVEQSRARRIASLTPVVCLGAKFDVVFLNEGRCTIQVKDAKTGKVVKSMTTLVSERAKGQKLVGNAIKTVGPLLFDTGTTALRAPALATIKSAKQAMSDATSILVVGHSGSALGNTLPNQQLSVQRAGRIRQMLVKGGVKTPINAYGLGALDPVTTMVYEFAQKTNRRVAIYLIP